jgi:uncharacterized protein (DUF1015 family)
VRYSLTQVADDLSAVVSQPYDRVRHGLQDKYYELSPYNIVRIIKGREYDGDGPGEDAYTRARNTYRSWLSQGVLERERSPALYVLRQTFKTPDGTVRTRQGLIAALQLARFDEGVVLPHERTHSGPKIDRLNLMRATEANFGHIFMLYPGGRINELLAQAISDRQGIELRELFERDVLQSFWPVTDVELIRAVVEEMAPRRNLIIADGHHRYETALNYRDEARRAHPNAPPNAAFNYRMVTLVSMEDPGLVILPTHRLIHSYAQMDGGEAISRAAAYFDVRPVASRTEMAALLAAAQPDRPRFGFYDGACTVLTLRNPRIMADLLPSREATWRLLDVTVGHELLIERVLGIDKGAVERTENISYLRDPQMGFDAVDRGEAQFLLVLNPTRMDQVRACTSAGERMPQKSTDFYPKVITGLVAMPIGADERI